MHVCINILFAFFFCKYFTLLADFGCFYFPLLENIDSFTNFLYRLFDITIMFSLLAYYIHTIRMQNRRYIIILGVLKPCFIAATGGGEGNLPGKAKKMSSNGRNSRIDEKCVNIINHMWMPFRLGSIKFGPINLGPHQYSYKWTIIMKIL